MMSRWVALLHDDEPDATMALRIGNSREVTALVRGKEVEVGFIGAPPAADLEGCIVGHDDLVLVVAPNHPLARHDGPCEPNHLSGCRLALHAHGSGSGIVVERLLATYDVAPELVFECSSAVALKMAVLTENVAAFLSRASVQRELDDRRLVCVPMRATELRRELHAVWLAGRPPTGLARRLVSVAQKLNGASRPAAPHSSRRSPPALAQHAIEVSPSRWCARVCAVTTGCRAGRRRPRWRGAGSRRAPAPGPRSRAERR